MPTPGGNLTGGFFASNGGVSGDDGGRGWGVSGGMPGTLSDKKGSNDGGTGGSASSRFFGNDDQRCDRCSNMNPAMRAQVREHG